MTDIDDDTRAGRRGPAGAIGSVVRGALGLVGSVVRIVTGLFAAVLALHIVLVLLGANPFNGFAVVVAAIANALTLGLANLFLLASPAGQVIVSYGVPAVAWLVIGALVVAILRALARPRSGLR